jgi:hypothetical protein
MAEAAIADLSSGSTEPQDRSGRAPSDKPAAERGAPSPLGDEQKEVERKPRNLLRRHPLLSAAAALLIVIVLAAATRWYIASLAYETTDDAFIDSRPVSISAQVSGAIVDVPVTDNQLIEAGGVLARIDNRDYLASLNQAKAQVDQANASIANYKAQIDEQQAHIGQAAQQVELAKPNSLLRNSSTPAIKRLHKGSPEPSSRPNKISPICSRLRPPFSPIKLPSKRQKNRSPSSRRRSKAPAANSSRHVPPRNKPKRTCRAQPSRHPSPAVSPS